MSDMHTKRAALIFNVPESEVTEDQRGRAKVFFATADYSSTASGKEAVDKLQDAARATTCGHNGCEEAPLQHCVKHAILKLVKDKGKAAAMGLAMQILSEAES